LSDAAPGSWQLRGYVTLPATARPTLTELVSIDRRSPKFGRLTDPATTLVSMSHTSPRQVGSHGFQQRIVDGFVAIFLPVGFPDSVTDDFVQLFALANQN